MAKKQYVHTDLLTPYIILYLQDQNLYDGCQITRRESILLIMGHIIRNHVSGTALQSLLTVLEAHLPAGTVFPASQYLFMKNFKNSDITLRFHSYCPSCITYIGSNDMWCENCDTNVSVSDCIDNGNYFITFDVKDQLLSMLQNEDICKHLQIGAKRELCDSYGGRLYRKLPLENDDITVSFNTDGIQVFVSSRYSIWPLQVMVNELPYAIRRKNIFLGGLWFGDSKPDMNTFLKPFVTEMNTLSDTGFKWGTENDSHTSRVFVTTCSCDSVARCLVQNVTQFNGWCGCNWCLSQGEVVSVGRGHARVYSMENQLPVKRNKTSHIEHARTAVQQDKPCMGVKGPSILFLLMYFDIVNNFVVDYMHSVCLGVARQVAGLWLDSSNHAKNFYIGNSIKHLSDRLQCIRPPKEITRIPGALQHRKSWKASEWRAWLLHYSCVVTVGFLGKQYHDHWMTLVTAMHLLLADKLDDESFHLCESLLIDFVVKFQQLYGKECMTYNVHQLLHVMDCVKNWGQLWVYSTFPFESMNGKLTKMFHGTTCVHKQISEKFMLIKSLPSLSIGAFTNSPNLLSFFQKNVYGFAKGIKEAYNETVCILGLPVRLALNFEQLCSLNNIGVTLKDRTVQAYPRLVLQNGLYFVSEQLKHKKQERNNSCFHLRDGQIGTLQLVVAVCKNECEDDICNCKKELYCIFRRLTSTRIMFQLNTGIYKVKGHQIREVEITNELIACNLSDIANKYIYMKIQRKTFVSLLPNAIELD